MNKTLLMSSISTLLLPLLFVPIMPIQQAKALPSLYGTWSQITVNEQNVKRMRQREAQNVVTPKARVTQKKKKY
jgi:hypothetical protein